MNKNITLHRFGYLCDPLYVACVVLYLVNRFWIKPNCGTIFFHAWLNDVICIPFTVPPMLWVLRRLRLRKQLQSIGTSFVHVNSLNMGRVAAPVLQSLGLRNIVHLRDIIRLSRTAIADLSCAQRLLAVSEATRRFHVNQGLSEGRCHVMYNGVDLALFCPKPATGFLHRELELPHSAKLLAVIGQIGLRKGQDQLLDILEPIFAAREDIHLLIVGQRWSAKPESIQYEQALRERSRRAPFVRNQRSRVHFLGIRSDMPAILNELVLLEAAACGCAAVATDVGGTGEIFPDSDGACVVPLDAPEAFRRAVESVLDDEELRKKLRTAARKRAEAVFSREKAAENLLRHYETVISAGNSAQ